MKPTIDIKDAYILAGMLWGIPVDYPKEHQYYPGAVTPGKEVHTSSIVKHEGNRVETLRSIYNVLNWKNDEAV